MPELPDVEGFRRYFARYAKGKRVTGVEVPAPDVLRNTSPQAFARSLRGRRFRAPSRHGKWLFAPTDGPTLLIHFGMTGGLRWAGGERAGDGMHRHDRVILQLDGGELRYRNMRKLGGIWVARDDKELEGITGDLGPDAQGVGFDELDELLSGRRGGLKATLMNQRLLAGIGNELSDEILWHARLNPSRSVSSLDDRDRRILHREMQRVIRESNPHGRIPRKRSWITSQRGRDAPVCPRCGGDLCRSRIAGRTAYWCPRCQSE
jgi:formamidopyrimidine-DNA glycosylase